MCVFRVFTRKYVCITSIIYVCVCVCTRSRLRNLVKKKKLCFVFPGIRGVLLQKRFRAHDVNPDAIPDG